eukprot:106574-Chlamydomonas_euryale.AAC.4
MEAEQRAQTLVHIGTPRSYPCRTLGVTPSPHPAHTQQTSTTCNSTPPPLFTRSPAPPTL